MLRLKERGLRKSFNIIVALLMVMLTIAAAGMVVSEREQRRLSRDLNRVYQTVVLADHIERDLLQLQFAHSQRGSGNGAGLEQMTRFERRLLTHLKEAAAVVDTVEEREEFERLDRLAQSAVSDLRLSREEGPDRGAVGQQASIRLVEAVAAAASFARINREQARGDILKARGLRQGLFIMRIVLALMMLAIAVYVLRLSREHLRAVSGLRESIQRFALGTGWVRAPRSNVTELNEVGDAFNDVVEQLERNTRERAVFLSAVAHDLRTPLSALQSAVQLLSREPDVAESIQRRVKVIQRQLDRMNNMVSDLQDAAGVEAGNLKLHRTEADLRTVVLDAALLFRDSTERHRIECHVPDEAVVLFFDETRIAQVLANLLSNAIKYSEGGRIRISLERGADVRVAVSDEGEGVGTEDAARLFMPFRRLDPHLDVPGMGLGLAVSKRLVEAHGGRLEVQSVRGQGSTFTIVLPLPAPGARTDADAEPSGPWPEEEGGALRH
ncbi:MAG TPA: HAMP domain-containing sensor histidine kinase [Myxococcaceae bacterium]|nr:HAMP domain-containing sensor histidine kinase [Myxococcaceae bacterium]